MFHLFQTFQDYTTLFNTHRLQPLEHLEQLERLERPSRAGPDGEESSTMKKADFRTFYKDAHAVECLNEREKMLIGLAVAMMRLCDP